MSLLNKNNNCQNDEESIKYAIQNCQKVENKIEPDGTKSVIVHYPNGTFSHFKSDKVEKKKSNQYCETPRLVEEWEQDNEHWGRFIYPDGSIKVLIDSNWPDINIDDQNKELDQELNLSEALAIIMRSSKVIIEQNNQIIELLQSKSSCKCG